jgi:hypothetical protein
MFTVHDEQEIRGGQNLPCSLILHPNYSSYAFFLTGFVVLFEIGDCTGRRCSKACNYVLHIGVTRYNTEPK